MTLLIITIVLSMGVSFACSLAEACLLSLSAADLAEVSERKPRSVRYLKRLKENIQQPLAVLLIINNLSNIGGASIAGVLVSLYFGTRWVGFFSFFFSLAVIQWSEYLPKTLGVLYRRRLATVVVWPLALLVRVLRPLVQVLDWLNRPWLRGAHSPDETDAVKDITLLTRYAMMNKQLSPELADIVSRSVRLSRTLVRDIMVNRDQIKYLSTSQSLAEALIETHMHHHTRYLLARNGDIDHVVGYVNVKDLVVALQLNPDNPTLAGIARPVLTVRPSVLVPVLLKDLTAGYQHMAVVKNDLNKTVGLVTQEDVLESVVGEIEDEFDMLPDYVRPLAEGRYLAGGGVTLAELREATGFDLPDLPVTLHDWICEQRGGLPRVEYTVRHGEYACIVRKIRRANVYEVIVEKERVPAAGTRSAGAADGSP